MRISKLYTCKPEYRALIHTAEYVAWRSMLYRCYRPGSTAYENYGGRNIRVCPQWRDDFLQFLADVGKKPTYEHSLDRIDVNGNYEPGNVTWSDLRTQSIRKRTTRFYTHDGVTKSMLEWSEDCGIPLRILYARLQQGWTMERAMVEPVRYRVSKKLPKVRNNDPLTYNGCTMTDTEWARVQGFSLQTIMNRRRAGWDAEKILCTPVGPQGPGKASK